MFLSAEQLQHSTRFVNSQFGTQPDEVVMSGLYGMTESDITKALATSGSIGTDASSMIGESLDPVVKVLTLQSPDFTPKIKRFWTYEAHAKSEEFTRVNAFGLAKGSFRAEGQLGVQDASQLERVTKNVRFLGQVGAVTVGMMRAAQAKFGNLKAFEATNRLHKLLLDLDRDIWWANSDLNSLAFEGILQQMSTDSDFNVNMVTTGIAGTRETYTAGGTLTTADIRGKSELFLLTNGAPTAVYLSPSEQNSISAEQDTNVRWYKADQQSSIAVGMTVDQIKTDFGMVDLIWDIWLRNYRGELTATADDPSGDFHSEVPNQPGTAPTGAVVAGGYLPVDVYYYGVEFVNEVGNSPIKLQGTGYTTTNANGKVNITVTMPASIDDIKSIRIYRSTTNGTDYSKMRLISETARTAAASATQVIADDGSIIPGSRHAVMLNEKMAAMGLLEAPNMFDLARVDNTERFGINAMAVIQLHNIKNALRFHNIGGSVTDPT